MTQLTEQEFKVMESYIRQHYGLDLSKKKYLIESKLCMELARCHVDNYTAYWQTVRSDRSGVLEQRMLDLLTTNYTYFCRERNHFDFLRTQVLPETEPGQTLRFWCAGCATGQECYTLSMELMDAKLSGQLTVPFAIEGTDLSEKAVAVAKKASYGAADYARLSPNWQGLYCEPFRNGTFTVRDNIRAQVSIRRQNLLKAPMVHGYYRVIFCRNVLIYFREAERSQLIGYLTDALEPGGYLFIGHTETLMGCEHSLEYIQPAVYRKSKGGARQ